MSTDALPDTSSGAVSDPRTITLEPGIGSQTVLGHEVCLDFDPGAGHLFLLVDGWPIGRAANSSDALAAVAAGTAVGIRLIDEGIPSLHPDNLCLTGGIGGILYTVEHDSIIVFDGPQWTVLGTIGVTNDGHRAIRYLAEGDLAYLFGPGQPLAPTLSDRRGTPALGLHGTESPDLTFSITYRTDGAPLLVLEELSTAARWHSSRTAEALLTECRSSLRNPDQQRPWLADDRGTWTCTFTDPAGHGPTLVLALHPQENTFSLREAGTQIERAATGHAASLLESWIAGLAAHCRPL
jgi:hypothetical protein